MAFLEGVQALKIGWKAVTGSEVGSPLHWRTQVDRMLQRDVEKAVNDDSNPFQVQSENHSVVHIRQSF